MGEQQERRFEVNGLTPMAYLDLKAGKRLSRDALEYARDKFDFENAVVWRARYKFIAQMKNKYGKPIINQAGQPILEEVVGSSIFSNVDDMRLSYLSFSPEIFYPTPNDFGVPLLPHDEFEVVEDLFAARQARNLMAFDRDYIKSYLMKYTSSLGVRIAPKIRSFLPDDLFLSGEESKKRFEESKTVLKEKIIQCMDQSTSKIVIPLSRIDTRLLEIAA